MSKPKFNHASALAAAEAIIAQMNGAFERVEISGSIRRGKEQVGDVEILYIPRLTLGQPVDMFAPPPTVNVADAVLERLLADKVIGKRLSVLGRPSWGKENKLAFCYRTQVPLDFFATTEQNWWNYMVCRTGPKDSNEAICKAARALGWMWHPTSFGFERVDAEGKPTGVFSEPMTSEKAVFDFVGLPYLEPKERK